MQCPICQDHHLVEIDYVGDKSAASSYVKECLGCGAVWSRTNKEISMITVPKNICASRLSTLSL